MKIEDTHVAIVQNDMSEEVLCYEFLGTIKNDTYRMFINADTGKEERVDKLKTQNLYIKTYRKGNKEKANKPFLLFYTWFNIGEDMISQMKRVMRNVTNRGCNYN